MRVCLVEPGPIKTEFMDALGSLVPAGGRTDPILDNAAPWMTADVEEVARRVAGCSTIPGGGSRSCDGSSGRSGSWAPSPGSARRWETGSSSRSPAGRSSAPKTAENAS